jgi:DNA-directed RNA polymerase subunit K/omega
MSDDEGGDYEDLDAGEALNDDEAEASSAASSSADEGEAESDDGDGDGDSDGDHASGHASGHASDDDADPMKAHPERQKADPILRKSNKAHYVQIVPPQERVTDNRLHKSEAARVIAMRAQQIAKFGTCFTEGGGLHDAVALAFKELYDRRCPLVLRRVVGRGADGAQIVEEWNVREMTLPPLTPPADLSGAARTAARRGAAPRTAAQS